MSLKRTDLALWSLDARRRLITCRLVEVKCYSSLPGTGGYEQLKERIAGQLANSEEILASRFDPAHGLADRPDRTVRNAELGQLLRFYLGRAVRHGTMRPDAAREAEWLLGNLDRGKYQMRFTRTGLIFDLAGEGTSSEADGGVEYHRIGREPDRGTARGDSDRRRAGRRGRGDEHLSDDEHPGRIAATARRGGVPRA